jgi:O-antigen ligase
MLYEIIRGPIQEEVYSRGIQRMRGTFADVMTYGIYISLGLLSSAYFYLRKIRIKFIGIENLFVFFGFSVLAIFKISHMTSYTVILALIVLIIFYLFNRKPGAAFFLFIILIGGLSYYGNQIFEQNISPLIEKDIMVLEGDRQQAALLHGRVGRWKNLWEHFENNSIVGKIFGMSLSTPSAYMISSGAHNDFLRIIFATGYLGFILYIISIAKLWFRSLRFQSPERFLVIGILTVFLLYSITTTPTYYVNFMYIFLSIYAFVSLDPEVVYNEPNTSNSN